MRQDEGDGEVPSALVLHLGERLLAAEDEVAALRAAAANAFTTSAAATASTTLSREDALYNATGIEGRGGGSGAGPAAYLRRQLREQHEELLLLQRKHEHVVRAANAERDLYDRALAALETQGVQLREARGGLERCEGELTLLRARAVGAAETEVELRRSRDSVRRLESSVAQLAAAPFNRSAEEDHE